MSNYWLTGGKTGNDRILAAVNGDAKLADKIKRALNRNQVERVLSKVDKNGVVTTFRLDSTGKVIGTWP